MLLGSKKTGIQDVNSTNNVDGFAFPCSKQFKSEYPGGLELLDSKPRRSPAGYILYMFPSKNCWESNNSHARLNPCTTFDLRASSLF